MRLVVLDEAKQELDEAAGYYELELEGRGRRLLVAYRNATEQALQLPNGGSPIRTARSGHTLRGHLLHHFPFTVVVAVEPEQLVVIAVAHHKRTPGYWRDRLKQLQR